MAALVIECIALFHREIKYSLQYYIKIRVHKLTVVNCDYGHKILFAVHTKGHFTVFNEIAEGILHLVSITKC